MTQKEFTERTGYTPTVEKYEEIENMYMNTNLDKDEFCDAWKNNRKLLKELERQTVLVRELCEERKRMEDFLIDQAEKWSAGDLREKAIAMVGEKEYICRKFEKGYKFWEADKELALMILRG